MLKAIVKGILSRLRYRRTKRWMDRRATSLAVALVCTGSLK